jgi:hypothetical protein
LSDLDLGAPVQSEDYDAVKISHGIIAAQANEGWPTPAIVRMTPKFNASNSDIEWNCNTNVQLIDQSICDLHSSLVY